MAWDRGSRHARGYGSQWVKTRERIMQRDRYLCQTCERAGRATPATEVDHITPKSAGGTDDAENLAAICSECHKSKTQREAASAQGHTIKQRLRYDASGNVIWPE